jgi:hypothetical protein
MVRRNWGLGVIVSSAIHSFPGNISCAARDYSILSRSGGLIFNLMSPLAGRKTGRKF